MNARQENNRDQLPPTDFISFEDELVQPAELVAAVRERLSERHAKSSAIPFTFPAYSLATDIPQPPDDIPMPYGLYYHLQRAADLYAAADTRPALAPSPATRLPVLGKLWSLIRAQAHSLVLYYVNRLLVHQTGTDRHLLGALYELTLQAETQQRTIEQLRAEVTALQRELEQKQ